MTDATGEVWKDIPDWPYQVCDDEACIMRSWFHIAGESIASIARLFMTTERVVSGIVHGRTYREAGGYGV
jgi:hypothetical protein